MFKIKAKPTFVAPVSIPVPGGEPETLMLVFRHKTRDEVGEYLQRTASTETKDVGPLMEIIEGWQDVDAEFSKDALQDLVQNYHGSVTAIMDAYVVELAEGRRKN